MTKTNPPNQPSTKTKIFSRKKTINTKTPSNTPGESLKSAISKTFSNLKNDRKRLLIIIACAVGIAAIAGTLMFLLARSGKTPSAANNSPETNQNQESELTEAEKYLRANWNNFNIDGSTSMVPLHQALNDRFGYPLDKITHSKTVDAFEKFIQGENDILLGVTYSDELLLQAKTSGADLAGRRITREGFIFLINKNNPVQNLTTQQIKDIYSGKITNWKDVGGENVQIKAYQRNDDSGSQIRMKKFMGDTKLMDKTEHTYIAESMGDLVLYIAGFSGQADAIGYNMYTFTEKQYPNEDIVMLGVDGVTPNDQTIFNETYPLVIYNYLYFDKNNQSASEFANHLYDFLMSNRGQKLISEAGYVNLNQEFDRNKDASAPIDWEAGG